MKNNDEKLDKYTAYLTSFLIFLFIVLCLLLFVQFVVGYLTAISIGGYWYEISLQII